MADGTLTVTYNTTTGKAKLSGIVVTDVIRRLLCQLGVIVRDGEMQGKLADRANTRASVLVRFNAIFDQDPNPYHATDNLTITFTAE